MGITTMSPRVSLFGGALVALSASLAIALAACGGSDSDTPDPGAPGEVEGGAVSPEGGATGGSDLPCDVDAVLAANCRQCHGAPLAYGAPMPLLTHADLVAPARSDATKKVYELVGTRTHDDAMPMPQPPNPRLDAADQSTLDTWIAAGAPSGQGTCAATDAGGAAEPKPLSCTPDTFIRSAAPFTMPSNVTDQYMCYGFDVATTGKRQVIGFAPKVDNKAIVHHFLLFQSPTTVSSTPTECDFGGSTNWKLVTGWAPGGDNLELPPEAGFAEDPSGTTHWVLQIHYNNIKGLVGEKDQSGYDLCTTDKLRPNDADTMAFGTISISIPPHATLDTTCTNTWLTQLPPVTVIESSPHMHLLGKVVQSNLFPKGSTTPTTILDQPAFQFQTGGGGFTTNVKINPGDTIKTRCMWNNTTDDTVNFGEKTENEMCFAFMIYYPKITATSWKWVAPAAVSQCAPTP